MCRNTCAIFLHYYIIFYNIIYYSFPFDELGFDINNAGNLFFHPKSPKNTCSSSSKRLQTLSSLRAISETLPPHCNTVLEWFLLPCPACDRAPVERPSALLVLCRGSQGRLALGLGQGPGMSKRLGECSEMLRWWESYSLHNICLSMFDMFMFQTNTDLGDVGSLESSAAKEIKTHGPWCNFDGGQRRWTRTTTESLQAWTQVDDAHALETPHRSIWCVHIKEEVWHGFSKTQDTNHVTLSQNIRYIKWTSLEFNKNITVAADYWCSPPHLIHKFVIYIKLLSHMFTHQRPL